ncbi:Uncharacterised protein [Weissella viridescens]|uniref:Pyrroline-5-carboxylate reductase catalytic N-terminal domain-containing protein n=1 Tax=Weissella viridescens TaxID=1629 RepID=A0A380P237_WEIVI|nr:Uncharacterised protein [Weissella viridescens]
MKVGIIGIGHMGQAITDGLLNQVSPAEIILGSHRINAAMQSYHEKIKLPLLMIIQTSWMQILNF